MRVAVIFCLLVLSTAWSVQAQEVAGIVRSLKSEDGAYQIRVPAGWQEQKDLNDSATIQAGDPSQEKYLIVITDSKQDFQEMNLEKHSEITRNSLLKSLQSPEVSGPVQMKVGGHPAVQYEIRGSINNLNIIYLHTTVETADNFHQILAWTLRSRFDKNRPALQEVISSFQELGQ